MEPILTLDDDSAPPARDAPLKPRARLHTRECSLGRPEALGGASQPAPDGPQMDDSPLLNEQSRW